jgi:hypothetical protein
MPLTPKEDLANAVYQMRLIAEHYWDTADLMDRTMRGAPGSNLDTFVDELRKRLDMITEAHNRILRTGHPGSQ